MDEKSVNIQYISVPLADTSTPEEDEEQQEEDEAVENDNCIQKSAKMKSKEGNKVKHQRRR